MISILCLITCAFGIKLSWSNGGRGSMLVWIGISMEVNLAEAVFKMTVSTKYALELRVELTSILPLSMVGVKRLRKLTGRLLWAAGIVPRSRWAVSTFYGVVTDALRAQKEGVERRRQLERKDARDKSGLVAVARLGLALHWMQKFWAEDSLWVRRLALKPETSRFTPCVDASPWGLGGSPVGRRWIYFGVFLGYHLST